MVRCLHVTWLDEKVEKPSEKRSRIRKSRLRKSFMTGKDWGNNVEGVEVEFLNRSSNLIGSFSPQWDSQFILTLSCFDRCDHSTQTDLTRRRERTRLT